MIKDVDAFLQARGIAAAALHDMTELLSRASPGPQAAPYLAFSAALQVVADGYQALKFAPDQAEQAMHHGVAVACRRRPVPTGAIWTEGREPAK